MTHLGDQLIKKTVPVRNIFVTFSTPLHNTLLFPYVKNIFFQWFQAVPTNETSFNLISGDCPLCGEVSMPQHYLVLPWVFISTD